MEFKNKKVALALLLAWLFPIITVFASQSATMIFSAMKLEQAPFLIQAKNIQKHAYAECPYLTASLHGIPIILATTGIGQVNAAIVSTLLISHLHPKGVIFSGVAGGLQKKLLIGDVVVSTKIFDVNLGSYNSLEHLSRQNLSIVGPINKKLTPRFFNVNDSIIAKMKLYTPKMSFPVYYGAIATDQHFPNNLSIDYLLQRAGVLAVAMEDNAIAQVCWNYNCSFISVRGISDNIIKNNKYTHKTARQAARSAAQVVIQTILLKHIM